MTDARKRYVAEFLGTFVITFAPVAASVSGGGLVVAALVSGLAVMAMVYALGPISAAHFNPAVSLGFAVAGRFPWRYVTAYTLCQFGGAFVAAAVAALLFGAGHGAHVPAVPGAILRNAGTEFLLSSFLMLVIVAVATDRRTGSTSGLAIGLTVALGVLVGGPITGGSMNPARSFGPAIFSGGAALSNLWLYLFVPPVGALLAALVYEALRLHPEHATGAPNELMDALRAIKADTNREGD